MPEVLSYLPLRLLIPLLLFKEDLLLSGSHVLSLRPDFLLHLFHALPLLFVLDCQLVWLAEIILLRHVELPLSIFDYLLDTLVIKPLIRGEHLHVPGMLAKYLLNVVVLQPTLLPQKCHLLLLRHASDVSHGLVD